MKTTLFVVVAVAFAAPLYVSWRVLVANRMPITDCDEVYNYWEPLHYMIDGDTREASHRLELGVGPRLRIVVPQPLSR